MENLVLSRQSYDIDDPQTAQVIKYSGLMAQRPDMIIESALRHKN